jgi:hypothetical protein
MNIKVLVGHLRKLVISLKRYGLRQTLHIIQAKMAKRYPEIFVDPGPTDPETGSFVLRSRGKEPLSPDRIVEDRFSSASPLITCRSLESDLSRVSIVTDNVNPGSLFGGVGTAIILGALLAESKAARLRIITRQAPAEPFGVAQVLKAYDLHLEHEPQFVFAPDTDRCDVDRHDDELFITTSWWTTASTLAGVPPKDILYLLQEDERMFYPQGDERFRCEQLLSRTDLSVVVNTKLMYDHLLGSGLPHLARQGMWFEPAFPPSLFYPATNARQGKRRLLFYARPENLRNMFYFGLEIIDESVRRGILDLDQWEVVLVGRNVPAVRLQERVPVVYTNLPWQEYAELIRTVDAGLCLMATPHPSYPPLDLAASGAVVLTNRFGMKQDLSGYSPNIVCADLNLESMLEGLKRVLELADNTQQRRANFAANHLQEDWRTSMAHVVQRFGDKT